MGSRWEAFSRKRFRWRVTSSRSSRSLGRRALASSTVKSLGKEGSTPEDSALAAHCKAVGEHAGETGLPDLGLGRLYVVLDEPVGDVPALSENVGGEGIPVAGLADRARVHQVGAIGAQIEGIGLDHGAVRRRGHRLDVGVAEKRSEERRVGKECRSRWSPYH